MAMKINLEEMNPATIFYFDEEDKDGGHVALRTLNGEKLEEINKRCRVRKVEVRGTPPTRFETLDFKPGGEEKEFEMTWDYCIVDWKGVVNHEGKEIPCNPENKVKLMKGSPRFSSFITKCARKLNTALDQYEEDLEKN